MIGLFQPPLYFSCNQCGACCRNFYIPLSHLDVLRLLAAHPETPLESLFLLRPAEAAHAEALLIAGEWWHLLLQRRDEACTFLDAEGRCGSYESRPRACRSFPFELAPTGLLQILPDAVELWEKQCDHDRVAKPVLRQARHETRLFGDEFADYCALVERWNRWATKQPPEHQTLPALIAMMKLWVEL